MPTGNEPAPGSQDAVFNALFAKDNTRQKIDVNGWFASLWRKLTQALTPKPGDPKPQGMPEAAKFAASIQKDGFEATMAKYGPREAAKLIAEARDKGFLSDEERQQGIELSQMLRQEKATSNAKVGSVLYPESPTVKAPAGTKPIDPTISQGSTDRVRAKAAVDSFNAMGLNMDNFDDGDSRLMNIYMDWVKANPQVQSLPGFKARGEIQGPIKQYLQGFLSQLQGMASK